MSAALGLYRLQQVDSQIDQILARLKAIQQIIENDLTLRTASEHFNDMEGKHKDAERALTLSESEVEKQQIKIQQRKPVFTEGKSITQKSFRICKKTLFL